MDRVIEIILSPQFLSLLALFGSAGAWAFQWSRRKAEVEKIEAETSSIQNQEWERLLNEVKEQLGEANDRLNGALERLDRSRARGDALELRVDALEKSEAESKRAIAQLKAQNTRLHNNLRRVIAQVIALGVEPDVDADLLK